MKQRSPVLWLACAAQVFALSVPAAAQGLRVPPTLDLSPSPSPSFSPAGGAARPADYIVAVVNSEPITNNEVRQRMARFEQQLQQQGQPVPPQPQFARQVLERLISEKAQLQIAREDGIKVDDAAVDTAEQNIARQNQVDVAELRRRLRAEGMALATFREELRDQILLGRLRDRELQSRVKVTDLEADQYLRDHQASSDPASLELNLAHILIAVPENATPAQVQALHDKALRVQQRARAGEDFTKLAHEVSDAPDAAQNGGVVGLRTGDRYPNLFLQAVQSVPEGGVSDVVRSGAGFHVLKVLEKRRGGLPGAVVMQSHVRHILLRTGAQLSEQAARERLLDFKRRIAAGQADFAQLAKQYSQDGSAANGGDLGWSSPGLFVPEFEQTIDELQPGQISDPVVTRFGVHLVQLLERRQEKLTAQQQREMARNILREKKLDDAYAEWAQEVRGRAYVEFRDPPT